MIGNEGVSAAVTAFWTLRFGILGFRELWPVFSLVSDRLRVQVSEQKHADTLDQVKMSEKKNRLNCRIMAEELH